MMKHAVKIYAGVFLAVLTSTSAFANCDLSILASGDTQIRNYNSLSRQTPHESIRIQLRNNGTVDCVGELSFDGIEGDGRLRGPQNTTLNYLILDERDFNHVLFDSQTNSRNSIFVNIRPNKHQEIKPKFSVIRGQSAASGLYRTRVEATFSDSQNMDIRRQASLNLSSIVEPTVQANFVGVSNNGNGSALMSLGELEPNMQRSIGLQLRSNTLVEVEVSSKNQGKLTRNSSPNGAAINYDMRIGGKRVDLGNNNDILLPANLSPRGQTSRIEIQLENFHEMPAGDYGDTVLFRITAR